MLIRQMTVLAALIFLGAHVVGQSAEPGRVTLRGHIPAAVARLNIICKSPVSAVPTP